MKRIAVLGLVISMVIGLVLTQTFAQDTAEAEVDSITLDSIARADSLKQAKEDSVAMALAKAKSDSIMNAEPELGTGFLERMLGSDLWDMYERGGAFMPYLLLASLLGVAIILWKYLIFLYLGVISFNVVGKVIYTVLLGFLVWVSRGVDVLLFIPILIYVLYSYYLVWTRDPNQGQLLATEVYKTVKKDGQDAAMKVCHTGTGPIASMLESGIRRWHRGPEVVEKSLTTAGTLEVAYLERGLVWLSTVAVVAPLLGFLGTVSGMISAFQAIAAAAQVNAKLVATGIFEALITTATGLMIAIPVHAFHNYFVSSVDGYVVKMEETAEDLVDAMTEK